jgi:hypothetical protein
MLLTSILPSFHQYADFEVLVESLTLCQFLQSTLRGVSRLEWLMIGFCRATVVMHLAIDGRHDGSRRSTSLESERYGHEAWLRENWSLVYAVGKYWTWLHNFDRPPALTRKYRGFKIKAIWKMKEERRTIYKASSRSFDCI